MTSKPGELETIERRLMQLEMEKLSLEQETPRARSGASFQSSGDRLARVLQEIKELNPKKQALETQWQGEKQVLDCINHLKEEESQLRVQIDQAEREYNLNKAAQLKYGRMEALQRELEEQEILLHDLQEKGSTLLRDQVTEADIAEVVAKWVGIPVTRLLETERHKLLALESYLHQRVIGQEEAVASVSAAIRRARAGMKDLGRPIGSFLFLGPTGVGKTELARALAELLFDADDAIVRIDMSEYMEKHAISRLIGAPPGYVGYDEGGQLSEAIRRRPYSVILFDEVEKAHPDIFNVLLQVLDDGRITDSQGRTVDFCNTVIIMTSNIGSDRILEFSGDDTRYGEMEKQVMGALRSHFRPEFLNRVDDVILFHSLRKEDLRQIVGIQLKRVEKLLFEQKIKLKLSDAALDHLVEAGYDPVYGARPIKRAIQRELENAIATKLLEQTFTEGDTIQVEWEDDRLVFQKQPSPPPTPAKLEPTPTPEAV